MFRVHFILSVLFLFPLVGVGQVEKLRELYLNARDEAGIRRYYDFAKCQADLSPVVLAHQGVSTAMYAQLVTGPREKYRWFNRGKDLLERASTAIPEHPEIAFLRFSVQTEAPRMLNYYDNLSADANQIVYGLRQKKIDPGNSFWQKALRFMLNSNKLNALQETELKRFIHS